MIIRLPDAPAMQLETVRTAYAILEGGRIVQLIFQSKSTSRLDAVAMLQKVHDKLGGPGVGDITPWLESVNGVDSDIYSTVVKMSSRHGEPTVEADIRHFGGPDDVWCVSWSVRWPEVGVTP